jgi:hypothetical protein
MLLLPKINDAFRLKNSDPAWSFVRVCSYTTPATGVRFGTELGMRSGIE